MSRPFRVGLTGGIGAGKTAVCNCFRKLGVPVIDADIIAREVVEPGQEALDLIRQHFGSAVITADGLLDRRVLREIIFADPEAKQALETILHPRITARMRAAAGDIDSPYCILCIPLLLETGQHELVDRILVVDVAEPVQVERVMLRDQCSEAQARAIIGKQMERAQRLRQADDIIVNQGSLDALCAQVDALHQDYLRAAGDPN